MKLATIWTIPAMTLAERLRRTGDSLAFTVAAHLPKRVRYWTFIQVGGQAMKPGETVSEARFMDLLERAEGSPR